MNLNRNLKLGSVALIAAILTLGGLFLCSHKKPKVKPEAEEQEHVTTDEFGLKQRVRDPDYTRSCRIEAYSIDNNNTWTKMGSWEKVTIPYNNMTGFWIFNDFDSKNEIQIPSVWHITITENTSK